ncbi:hypothetical protein GW17_00027187 [Ensete ventricosum]|nr:hypothetical protein GW17_00027187 [Ensete ventricosum]
MEEDGRVFPVSNSSASIVDSLLNEAKSRGDVSLIDGEQFLLKVEKRTMNFVEYIKADYVLMAMGSSQQVGPMLVTHWGLSGPVILRLSAWGARELFLSNYTGK